MTTIIRRKAPIPEGLDERRRWLRFTDGLIVDYARCPKNIQSHPHWRRDPTPVAAGEPNAVCLCVVADPPSTDRRFCVSCAAKDRVHVDGACLVCGHRPAGLRPCVACGRPCTGRWCTETCRAADEGPLDVEDRS